MPFQQSYNRMMIYIHLTRHRRFDELEQNAIWISFYIRQMMACYTPLLWKKIPLRARHRRIRHDPRYLGCTMSMMHLGLALLLIRCFMVEHFCWTPVVEDVGLEDGDGAKDCTSVPNNCEWRHVVVVSQGKGADYVGT